MANIKKINSLSNTVSYDESTDTIIKLKGDSRFNKYFKNQEPKILSILGRDFTYKNNILKIKYIDHKPFDDKKMTDKDIISVAKAINELHSTKITKKLKEPAFIASYKKVLKFVQVDDDQHDLELEKSLVFKAYRIMMYGEQVLLHNDLVEGNLLKTKDGITLIDFEYGGMGNPVFDVASFITEREISKKQIKLFIDNIDREVSIKQLMIVSAFLQIYWYRWAKYNYLRTGLEIYNDIAKFKLSKYKAMAKQFKVN